MIFIQCCYKISNSLTNISLTSLRLTTRHFTLDKKPLIVDHFYEINKKRTFRELHFFGSLKCLLLIQQSTDPLF